ncbi:MAG: DUF1653 domain-containing protein [Lachnospiraceae bacterium]|nr:DUF1653 domain-containing protein [Lachnospiraceae bacterium]
MAQIPKSGEVYKHFKGTRYVIVDTAIHSETGERLVIYRALDGDGGTYARPLDMFISRVDSEKYPDVTQKYRFELQPDEGSTLDPMLAAFLDADNYEDRLNIMVGMRDRVDKEMLTTMAIACDIPVPEGDISEQFDAIRTTLLTRDRYEGSRLR